MKKIKNIESRNILTTSKNKLIMLMIIIMSAISMSGCNLVSMAKRSYSNAMMEKVWKDESRIARVPFKLLNDHIIMPVSINGGHPLNFILDSGAATTVIFESHRTKKIELDRSFPISLSGAGHGKSSIAFNVKDTDITVGSLTLKGASVVYLPVDSAQFFKSLDEVYFDGVIGYDFLQRFPLEIDYERMIVSIYRDTSDLPDLTSDEWQKLELNIESRMPTLVTKLKIASGNNARVKLILDTGYTDALSIDVSSSENLSAPQHFYNASLKGMSGRESAMIANTQSINFGVNSIANFPGFYEESSNISNVNGVMGNKILSQFNLVFDYDNEQLFIKPNQRFSIQILMDKSGLQVYPHLLGGYIDDVAIDSGAELLGLKRGDIITTFNETAVTDETLTLLQKTLASNLATIEICWVSKGKNNCGSLELSTLL